MMKLSLYYLFIVHALTIHKIVFDVFEPLL